MRNLLRIKSPVATKGRRELNQPSISALRQMGQGLSLTERHSRHQFGFGRIVHQVSTPVGHRLDPRGGFPQHKTGGDFDLVSRTLPAGNRFIQSIEGFSPQFITRKANCS